MAESRIVRRYFREKQARGKRLIARVLDTVALLLLLFAGTYLFLRNKALRTEHALPLAIVASLFAGVILLIVRRASLLRFIPRETDRLSRKLLSERLCLLDGRRFRSLCRKASGERTPVVFQCAEPVSADELLPLLKKQKDATLTVCASAGFTKTAETLARHMPERLRLIGEAALVDTAMRDAALHPRREEVYAAIEREQRIRREKRRGLRRLPIGAKSLGAYLIAAGVLLLCSYFTRYTLYYRLLAGLSVSIAGARFLLRRGTHTPPSS